MFDFERNHPGYDVAEIPGDVTYVVSFNNIPGEGTHMTRIAGIVAVDGEDVRFSLSLVITNKYYIRTFYQDGDPEW